jgi:glucokinase
VTGFGTGGAPRRVGVDLGGTSSRIVALDPEGGVVSQHLVDTRSFAAGDGESVAQRLIAHVRKVSDGLPLRSVGIGASGPVDANGVIRNPDTLPEFSGIEITSLVTAELGVPCVIDSDAITFALGEFHLGAGRAARSIVGVTLGTGVGVGVVVDGRPHRGGDGLHPEGGHIPTPGAPAPCYCGLQNCWEQRASRTALERMVAARFDQRSVASVASAAEEGDPEARDAFTEYGVAVGTGLAALATLFRPEAIVIGGGSTPYVHLLMDGLRAALVRRGSYATTAEIVPSELGVLAGAIGAATLV